MADRRHRAMVRDTRLRELGFTDYAAYLRSPEWRDVRERYKASDLPQICMCGATKVQLHHTTYGGRRQRVVAELIAIRPNMSNRDVRHINGANERKLARLMVGADERDERLRSEATPAEFAVRSFSPDASDGGRVARRSRLPENDRG